VGLKLSTFRKNGGFAAANWQPEKGSARRPYFLDEIIQEDSGRVMNKESFEKKRARFEILDAQDDIVVERLRDVGIELDRNEDITLVGMITGQEIKLKSRRNTNFLACHQRRNRRKNLMAATEFFEEENNKANVYDKANAATGRTASRIKYAVVNTGPRVTIDELDDTLDTLNAIIRKVIRVSRPFGVEFFLKSIEIPYDEAKMGTFHPHANLAYRTGKAYPL
jgi:hypothetical protein